MSFSDKIDKPHPTSTIVIPSLTAQRKSFLVPDRQSRHEGRSSAQLPARMEKSAQLSHNLAQFSIAYSGTPVQTKLTIGEPGDRYEQEADRVAQQVMSANQTQATQGRLQRQEMPQEEELQTKPILSRITSSLQRQEEEEEEEMQMKPEVQRQEEEEEEEVQTKSMVQTARGGHKSDLEQNLSSSRGGGRPLPDETRTFMESRFGADFSQVKVHDDSKANQMSQSIQAQAFTHGKDIYFNSGRYSPETNEGKTLLAHELTHVVQQTGEQ